MRISHHLSRMLSFPAVYRLFSRLVGGNVWQVYLAQYVKPLPGEKVLDIGCGPADVLDYLPCVNYTGLDISPEYIDSAKKRFGKKGRFLCADVGLVSIQEEFGTFSLVMATGVVHHLDNERASKLFELARRALRPDGRLITYDGCYGPAQSGLVRWLLTTDRGKFVRTCPEYVGLAATCFSTVEPYLRSDLLRIPYSHLIMRCSN